MTIKATPGPWRCLGDDGLWLGEESEWTAQKEGPAWQNVATEVPIFAGEQTIAIVVWEGWDDSEGEATAHLMTAAPDLYTELEHLVRLLEPLEQSGELNVPGLATLNGARDALAKARGEK